MSINKREPETGISHSDQRGMQLDSVQPGPGDCKEEVDWKKAFQILSASLSRQFVSGSVIYLIAMDVKKQAGEEALSVMAEAVCLNRDRSVHKFMG